MFDLLNDSNDISLLININYYYYITVDVIDFYFYLGYIISIYVSFVMDSEIS